MHCPVVTFNNYLAALIYSVCYIVESCPRDWLGTASGFCYQVLKQRQTPEGHVKSWTYFEASKRCKSVHQTSYEYNPYLPIFKNPDHYASLVSQLDQLLWPNQTRFWISGVQYQGFKVEDLFNCIPNYSPLSKYQKQGHKCILYDKSNAVKLRVLPCNVRAADTVLCQVNNDEWYLENYPGFCAPNPNVIGSAKYMNNNTGLEKGTADSHGSSEKQVLCQCYLPGPGPP